MPKIYSKEERTQTVCIAHFSVQKYSAIFGLSGATAHAEIAQICLIYWLEPGLAVTKLDKYVLENYPLANFAAKLWYDHYTHKRKKSNFSIRKSHLEVIPAPKRPFSHLDQIARF